MTEMTLIASSRALTGKGASRRLRRLEQKIPAILYGAGKDPLMLAVENNRLRKAMETEAFFSQIITLVMDGKKQEVVLRDIQRHPSKPEVLHLDFLRITGKEAINMTVPIHFENEDIAPGVKFGGIVSHVMTELEVKCLPKDLPEYIAIDLANVELDGSIHLSDLTMPNGVELVSAELDTGHDAVVVSIHKPKRAAEPEEASADAGEDAASGGSDAGSDKSES